MLKVNEIVRYTDRTYRVLQAQPDGLFWIDINASSAVPAFIAFAEIAHAIDHGLLTRAEDPYDALSIEKVQPGSPGQIKRDSDLNCIKELVTSPQCFDSKFRSTAIKRICKEHGRCKATIYKLLRRYWQRGQTPNALLPDYKKSGAKGKKRLGVKNKLGRPRIHGEGRGAIIDEEVIAIFKHVIENYYFKNKNTPLTRAHREVLKIYGQHHPEFSIPEAPTIRQLRYFLKKEYPQAVAIKERTSTIEYNKDVSPNTSTVNNTALGPASRVEIDATIADIYLVSDQNHEHILGRPTVYLVIDTFSRLVAGLHISFQPASYVTAVQALWTAMTDKAQYCKQHDIEISPKDWPAIGLPGAILADRGELQGHQIESLERGFSVRIENTAPYRGDAKGIVESKFHTLQAEFKPYAPGVVEKTMSKKRGDSDYRLDAALTVSEFKKIMLSTILLYNQFHVLEKYDRSPDMPPDLELTPLSLWNWGIQNRTGIIRTAPEEQLRISLLPRVKASVSGKGICVFGLYYSSSELLQAGWLHRSPSVKRPKNLWAAYDPSSADNIVVFPDEVSSSYWVCGLSDRSREFAGRSFWDVWQSQKIQKDTIARSKAMEEEARIKHESYTDGIFQKAHKRSRQLKKNTGAERIRGINSNKQQAREEERNAPLWRPSIPESASAKVLPFPNSTQQLDEDYSYPHLIDELFDEEDK